MRLDLLRKAREERKMTYRELSGRTGLSLAYVYRVLRGQHPRVPVTTVVRLCRALEVPIRDVLADEDIQDEGSRASA